MTASTVVSTAVTNVTASPQVLYKTSDRDKAVTAVETVAVATTSIDETGDAIVLMPIPSGADIVSLVVYNTDMDSGGTSGSINIGVVTLEPFMDVSEETNIVAGATKYAALGAVGAATSIVSASTVLTAANLTGTQLRYQNDATLVTAGKRLWDLVGLARDPHKLFALKIAVQTAMTTPVAGSLVVRVEYMPN